MSVGKPTTRESAASVSMRRSTEVLGNPHGGWFLV
jgi:hypothetical protein